MLRISQLNLPADTLEPTDGEETVRQLVKKAAVLLHIRESRIKDIEIVRRSVDARKKPVIVYSYTVDVKVSGEEEILGRINNPHVEKADPVRYHFPDRHVYCGERPVITGSGPAGLFCGYYLALAGMRPIILERGSCVEERCLDVEHFWESGELAPDSNVQFGEGGAGTFSDGKLNTMVKDKYGRNRAVLETFVRFGAGEEILYDARPHLGTDKLCEIVRNMRQEIISLGGEVRFHARVSDLDIEDDPGGAGVRRICGVIINGEDYLPCTQLVLAIGHSSRDTFEMLDRTGVPMEAKPFAVGLRVEHPQAMINKCQYGMEDPGSIGAASYRLKAQTSLGRGVYSFCMCPGGYVVNASSEPGRTAVNGMSYSKRNGVNANSAILVEVRPDDYGSGGALSGVAFQRRLEEKAYELGRGKIPVQRYGDYRKKLEGNGSGFCGPAMDPVTEDEIVPQNKGGYVYADLSELLPGECSRAFVEGMTSFGHMIPGFDRDDAILSGVESRSSSPVRILRDDSLESSIEGLYPCGEGAGYAGGITSAAMDGLRVAEKIAGKAGLI